MRKILSTSMLFFLLLGGLIKASFAALPNDSLAPMLQKVLPAVVNVRAQIKITNPQTLAELQREQQQQGQTGPLPDKALSVGSGTIVDAERGYILTNAHVVDDAVSVVITLSDGRHFKAKIIGLDKPSDIAVLQVRAKNLNAIPIYNSNDLKVGDVVAAIGNPFGLNQTVTSGIISALGRSTLNIEGFENFIQTDAPINPGNSGGALINTQGELVGINTAILAPNRGSIGIGFAIPSNMAKSIMLQLIEYGDVKRGALGVGAQDITPELSNAFGLTISQGAVLTEVIKNSPAEKAGLQVGDVITKVNGADTKNANDVVNAIAILRVDSKASVEILRNNKPISITAMITDPKKRKEMTAEQDPFLYGVGLKDFEQLSPQHGNIKGVLVVSIEEDSNAWQSDLRPGDVIISANQKKIENIPELRDAATNAKNTLLINILRGQGALFLVINKES
jgi:serine protease Do